ncbi:MAG TPA: transcription repressor NadR, partial [Peptococcaceae bacterium]|nr:transcription repressor NadR [Peptococcaceae bacterium]
MMSAMRREGIHKILVQSSEPISATALAKIFNVSRQVIVGDVALPRAASVSILATPRGYLLEQRPSAANVLRTIACKHS